MLGVDGEDYRGALAVKVGPVTAKYEGVARFVERDEAARRMVVEATGKDIRSAGTAAATVTATLAADGDRTAVEVITDLTVTGRPAQFGRGMLAEVGSKLIGQFADCLANTLGEQDTAPADAPPGPPALRPEQSVSGSTAGTATAATAAAAPAVPGGAAASAGEDSVTASDPAVAPPGRVVEGESQRIPSSAPIEAEPIDLLRLTGATATARRITRYGAGAVLLIGLAWLVLRRLRR